MPRPRKTIDLASVVEVGNRMLADSQDDKAEGRVAVAIFLEEILRQANAYAGFAYTDTTTGPDGKIGRSHV